jgi:hypothetical protein
MTISMNKNRIKIIEELTPSLLHKIRPTIMYLKRYYSDYLLNEDYTALAKEALFLAAGEYTNKKQIFKKAYSIATKWLYADVRPKIKEKLRKPSRVSPDHDFFVLPWGVRLDGEQINSGIGNEVVAVSPNTTDKEIYIKDSAQSLYAILTYIMEYWGPHALVWFVMASLNDNKYIETLKQLGVSDEDISSMGQYLKQGERTINRIKEDIKEQFSSGKLI